MAKKVDLAGCTGRVYEMAGREFMELFEKIEKRGMDDERAAQRYKNLGIRFRDILLHVNLDVPRKVVESE